MNLKQELYIQIGELSIPYTIKESKQTKYIKLVIGLNGLTVVKPAKVKLSEVEKVLQTKRNWIYKHHLNFQRLQSEQARRNWENGETVLYQGEHYQLRVSLVQTKTVQVKFTGENFEVWVNEAVSESEQKTLIEEAFRRWYRMTAVELIKERVDYYCKIIGLNYHMMRLKEQKTRWGSCSQQGNLNFNWKLIMAPAWVMDYVIVHELCHLRYLNHSRDFWSLVECYFPNYQAARVWLKQHGLRLTFNS